MDLGDPIARAIEVQCASLCDLLKRKNAKYGNSALAPKRICSKADDLEQLFVRIDDKLSRLANMDLRSKSPEVLDAIRDLIGYFTLVLIQFDR